MRIAEPTPGYSPAMISVGRRSHEVSVLDAVRRELAGKTVNQVIRHLLDKPQADCPVVHRFGPGIYIREITVQGGVLAVGHYHKQAHLNVMLKGRVTVIHEDGSMRELVAPMVFVGQPGRKIGYIHEEMVWQNIYATTETDVETLEAMFLDKSPIAEDDLKSRLAIQRLQHEPDRLDFQAVLKEFGFDEETARAQSEFPDDQIPLPMGSYKIMVTNSPIEGKGVFATADIEPGEVIAPARIGGNRTPAGRYTNHAVNPNARPVLLDNGDVDLVATRAIKGCAGGRPGEEITIDYRHALALNGIRRIQ